MKFPLALGGRGTERLDPKFVDPEARFTAPKVELREAIAPPFGRAPLVIPALVTVGREKARDGGAAVRLAPRRLAAVGFTGTLPPREALANWLAGILTPIPRTDIELVRARCGTAMVPPGARRFA